MAIGLTGCQDGPFQTTALPAAPPALIPNDEYFSASQWNLPLVRAAEGWALAALPGFRRHAGVAVVAVIDQAVVAGHPDLEGVLTADGFDFINNRPLPTGADLAGDGRSPHHGTHVAGIIGALTANGIGVAGTAGNVAGAPTVRIMTLRIFNDSVPGQVNSGNLIDLIDAILYAGGVANDRGVLPARRADVINMSLGGPATNREIIAAMPALEAAIVAARAKGTISVAAIGNRDSSVGDVPAILPGVIGVGSIDVTSRNPDGGIKIARSAFSSFGAGLDIVAPGGVDKTNNDLPILSTWPTSPGYHAQQGTSMATPHVSAALAMARSLWPSIPTDTLEQALLSTARDLGDRTQFGAGLLDVGAFLTVLVNGGVSPSGVGGETLSQTLYAIRDRALGVLPHASVATAPGSGEPAGTSMPTGFATGRVTVVLDPAVLTGADALQVLDGIAAAAGVRWAAPGAQWLRRAWPVGQSPDEALEALSHHPAVIWATIETNDPLFTIAR